MGAIAELFIKLGITGGDKASQELESTESGLAKVESAGLAAKAAIAAMVYGLERMFAASARGGTELSNLTALTGVGAQFWQQYGNAAKVAGASAEEVHSTIVGIQKTIADLETGKGLPEGAALLGIDMNTRDPVALFNQIVQGVKRVDNEIGNAAAHSLGFSDSMIALARRGQFDPGTIAKMPYFSEKAVKSQDAVNRAMQQTALDVEMAFGRFTAKHGPALVNDFKKVTDELIRFSDVLEKIATKFHIFEAMDKAVQAVTGTLDFAGFGLAETFLGGADAKQAEKALGKGFLSKLVSWRNQVDDSVIGGSKDFGKAYWDAVTTNNIPALMGQSGPAGNQTTTISNTYNIRSTDPKGTRREIEQMHIETKSKIPLVRPHG